MNVRRRAACALFAFAALAASVHAAPASAAAPSAPKTVALLDTLSKDPTKLYDYGWGPAINGPLWRLRGIPGRGPSQYWAVAFTPAQDIDLTQIVAPLLHDDKKDLETVGLAIYDDANGVPGQRLHTWHNLGTQNQLTADNVGRYCCSVVVKDAKRGAVPLTGGTTYWLVALTTDRSRFQGLWYYNSTGATGTSAYWNDINNAWTPQHDVLLPAVGIYGIPR